MVPVVTGSVVLGVSGWWTVGFIVGGVVVLIAAVLLVAIILLGRRIVAQAEDITASLQTTAEQSAPLFELAATNHSLDRIVRAVRSGSNRSTEQPT